jgi:hexosaminidase
MKARTGTTLALLLFGIVPGIPPVSAQTYNLIPQPEQIVPGPGRLAINAGFSVALEGYREPRLEAAAIRMIHRLAQRTGLRLNERLSDRLDQPVNAALVIHCDHAGQAIQSAREEESDSLEITPQQARLSASTPLGVLHGMETFLQLIEIGTGGASAPVVNVTDRPRFPWRGLMIDVSRHWMPIEVLTRNIDAMAVVKLNVLHLHLTDDQGFRIETKLFQRLQEMGSDGHFYTQQQLRDLVVYARDRGIRVPEMDMPGHTASWLAGYPELASGPGPFEIERKWGIFNPTLDPTREETYTFLDRLIGEVAAIFPDAYFHVGGDEVNGVQWNLNPRIEAFKQSHGIKDNAALQAYFNDRVAKILDGHGKKVIGWEEILHAGLPPGAIVQSWRGSDSLISAARAGYMSILSRGYYLDSPHSPADFYRVDPLAGVSGLTSEQASTILGGEACMWSEFVTPENIDSRIWPSAAAIAERLWSEPQVPEMNNVDSLYRRLNVVSRELESVGVTHRSGPRMMLARLAGAQSPEALQTLADVIEPVNPEIREKTREYTSSMTYDRLVDAVLPYSEVARIFAGEVDHLPVNREAVRRQLGAWRDNRVKLIPLMQKSALLEQDIPLSEDLSAVAQSGLEALDYLDSGHTAPKDWVEEQEVLLSLAAKPHDELTLMIVEPVSKLVEAAQRGSW